MITVAAVLWNGVKLCYLHEWNWETHHRCQQGLNGTILQIFKCVNLSEMILKSYQLRSLQHVSLYYFIPHPIARNHVYSNYFLFPVQICNLISTHTYSEQRTLGWESWLSTFSSQSFCGPEGNYLPNSLKVFHFQQGKLTCVNEYSSLALRV